MPQEPTKPRSGNSASTTADEEPRGFLQRWSQRKVEAATDPSTAPSDDTKDLSEAASQEEAARSASESEAVAEEAPPEVTEADLENLTYESDYTKFMGEHVPEAIRRRALQQLWRSDPILANLDGLCDYDDDFTDAALAVKVLKTAHKVGQGYLTDEEVAANRARGKPPEETPPEREMSTDEDEDTEDVDDDGDTGEKEIVADASADDTSPEATPEPDLDASDNQPETKAS